MFEEQYMDPNDDPNLEKPTTQYKIKILRQSVDINNNDTIANVMADHLNAGWQIEHQSTAVSMGNTLYLITVLKKYYTKYPEQKWKVKDRIIK